MLSLVTAYAALCGFYYLYMASLCLAVYVLVRTVSFNNICKRILTAVGWYAAGIGLSAPVLFPALKGFLGSERNSISIFSVLFNIKYYIPQPTRELLELIYAALNPLHSRERDIANITVFEFAAVLLLFFLPRSRKKRQCIMALLICGLAFFLPITGYLFNGFGETNDRWMFFFHFLLALILAVVLSELKSIAVTGASGARIISAKWIRLSALLLVPVNLIGGLWLLYLSVGGMAGDNWREEMIAFNDIGVYIDSPANASETLMYDNDLYRVSNSSLTNVNGRPENIAMLNGYYGLTYWFSIVNGNTMDYAHTLNEKNASWRSYGFDNNTVYEAMAGVKYYMTDDPDAVSAEYELADTVLFNDREWYIYENTEYFGMAYLRSREESSRLEEECGDFGEYLTKLYEGLCFVGTDNIYYNNETNIFSCSVDVCEGQNELIVLLPYNGNWTAYVDGARVDISKADKMYLSIAVDSGTHEVVVQYVPYAFYLGLCVMLIAMIGIAIGAACGSRRRKCGLSLLKSREV